MRGDYEGAIRKAVAAGRTPVDLWLAVLGDDTAPLALRLSVARDAAPYIHPKLAHTITENIGSDKLNEMLALMREERSKMSVQKLPVLDAVEIEEVSGVLAVDDGVI